MHKGRENPQTALEHRVAAWAPEERDLLARIDLRRLPRHVAIIMDGNGRWARQHGFRERIEGHKAATESVRAAMTTSRELGIGVLTLYAFSTENWSRPQREIQALMRLLEQYLKSEIPELLEQGIRLVASGHLDDLYPAARKALDEAAEATMRCERMILNLALSYGGRQEIADAAREIARLAAEGQLDPESVTPETFAAHLYRPELGDPDLLIRTSGEMRVSNFLLWQIAYAELHVTPVLWPDFRRVHFLEALIDFQGRHRRFGRVS